MECTIHFIIFSYTTLVICAITGLWWIANIVVQWNYKNYYPIKYQNLDKENRQLKNELKKYEEKYGKLP